MCHQFSSTGRIGLQLGGEEKDIDLKFHVEKDLSRQFGSQTPVNLMHGNVQRYPIEKSMEND